MKNYAMSAIVGRNELMLCLLSYSMVFGNYAITML